MNRTGILLLFFLYSVFNSLYAQPQIHYSSSEIQLALEKLNTLGTVLYVAAHPDDENTRLLSYLANERKYRTVYLSVTRGDGGQNLIGNEQGYQLGMIRTRELLAARNIDNAEQTFTRCNDFGYSKTPDETFRFWNHDEALADVVWAIRKYRPDVIINRFPTTGEGGHGHHTASAILSVEAFRAAGDSTRFRSQLKYVSTWQAKRIFFNSFNFRNQPPSNFAGQIKLDVGGYNALLGKSYGEIASESRSMHKSQGFGVARSRGEQFEHFVKLDGDTAVHEIFESINTTWKRVRGGDVIQKAIEKIIAQFNPGQPQKSVAPLLDALKMIRKIDDDYWKVVKEKELSEIIIACSGLWFEAVAGNYYAAPGDSVQISVNIISRIQPDIIVHQVSIHEKDTITEKKLSPNIPFSFRYQYVLHPQTPYTNPYWLNHGSGNGIYDVKEQTMVGKPWNESVINAAFHVSINGVPFLFRIPVTHKWTDPVKGELYRPFEVVPAVSLSGDNDVITFLGSEPKKVTIKLVPAVDSINGKIHFEVPADWNVFPSSIEARLHTKDKPWFFEATVTPPPAASLNINESYYLKTSFESGNNRFTQSVQRIQYDHIPNLVSLRTTKIPMVVLDMKTVARRIGYIEGAGDDVAKCLRQAGFSVDILDEKTVMTASLNHYDAIVTGIRAYNTNDWMANATPALMKYVEQGGNLVVQYNTNNFLGGIKYQPGPYPFNISRERVTDETAVPTFLKPDHTLLNFPNKIMESDFSNWVQERGLYFANELDPNYETVLSWNDPGEKALDGSLIMAKKGDGVFIYTGIAFFRQLPAGVPGAYRLMANILNAGKKSK